MSIEEDAKKLAEIIKNTDTKYRGNLLLETAKILKNESQGFTGNLIEIAANEYGILR